MNGREHRKNAVAFKNQKQSSAQTESISKTVVSKRKNEVVNDEKSPPKRVKESPVVPSDFFDDAHPAVVTDTNGSRDDEQVTLLFRLFYSCYFLFEKLLNVVSQM